MWYYWRRSRYQIHMIAEICEKKFVFLCHLSAKLKHSTNSFILQLASQVSFFFTNCLRLIKVKLHYRTVMAINANTEETKLVSTIYGQMTLRSFSWHLIHCNDYMECKQTVRAISMEKTIFLMNANIECSNENIMFCRFVAHIIVILK